MNFRLLENYSRGFYVQLIIPGRAWDLPPLPETFLNVIDTSLLDTYFMGFESTFDLLNYQVVQKKNIVTFTSEVLLLAEQRMTKILEEIHNITNLCVSNLNISLLLEFS